jgi:hypothetical protein
MKWSWVPFASDLAVQFDSGTIAVNCRNDIAFFSPPPKLQTAGPGTRSICFSRRGTESARIAHDSGCLLSNRGIVSGL